MKTASKQQGIRVAKIPELVLWVNLAPERRYARRWVWRLRKLGRQLAWLLLERPELVRVQAPGLRVQPEHEWRQLPIPYRNER